MLKFNIKDMKLYQTTDRFLNNYNNLKTKLKREPTLEELSEIDQLHYNGIKAVNEAITKTKITKSSMVLDIGSGIGGPARFIANKTKSKLYAIEIQHKLNQIAKNLTSNYMLNRNIKHIKADILTYDFKNIQFTNIVSWLSLYHIPNRINLLKKLSTLLHEGGFFYAEDFYLKKKLNRIEKNKLAKIFHANHLVSLSVYQKQFVDNNFEFIELKDMSKNWTVFTKNRLDNYKKNINNHMKVNNKVTVDNVLSFYNLAFKLLSENIIGGLKFIAKKKKF